MDRKSFQQIFDKQVEREAFQRTAQSSEKVRNTFVLWNAEVSENAVRCRQQ
jgi:hypothetical protein